MAFSVEIAPQAFDDLDSISDYIQGDSSFAVAERWFNGKRRRCSFVLYLAN